MRTYKQALTAHGKIGLNALLAGEITSLRLAGISNEFQRVNFMIIPLREKGKKIQGCTITALYPCLELFQQVKQLISYWMVGLDLGENNPLHHVEIISDNLVFFGYLVGTN